MAGRGLHALRLLLLAFTIGLVGAARIKRKSMLSSAVTCPSTVNTFFPKEHRIDCEAFDSQSQDEDERRRICYEVGCCWSPLEHGSPDPWCFSKPLCPAYVEPNLRSDCDDFKSHPDFTHWDKDKRGRACESVGCCWQPLEENSGKPWCFKQTKGPGDTAQRKSPIEEKQTPTRKPEEEPHDDSPAEDKTSKCGKYPGRDEKRGTCINLQTDEDVPEPCCGGEDKHDDSAEQPIVAERSSDEDASEDDEDEVIPEPVVDRSSDEDASVDDEDEVIPQPEDSHKGPQPGTVVVFVDRAKNLPDTDSWGAGKTDAFVMVNISGREQHTSAIRNSLNPQWNEKLTFNVRASDAIVKMSIKDQDQYFNFWWDGHDHIHDLEVSFRGLSPEKEFMFTETIQPHGSIQFRLKWQPHQ